MELNIGHLGRDIHIISSITPKESDHVFWTCYHWSFIGEETRLLCHLAKDVSWALPLALALSSPRRPQMFSPWRWSISTALPSFADPRTYQLVNVWSPFNQRSMHPIIFLQRIYTQKLLHDPIQLYEVKTTKTTWSYMRLKSSENIQKQKKNKLFPALQKSQWPPPLSPLSSLLGYLHTLDSLEQEGLKQTMLQDAYSKDL